MSRAKAIRRREEKELRDKGYIECAYCEGMVSPKAVRCGHCGKWFSSGKKVLALAIASALALAAIGAYYLIPGSPGYSGPTGDPRVLSSSPTGISVPTTALITVEFDREMNRTSVQQAFSVAPGMPGAFSWSGTEMEYRPTVPLTAGKLYSVNIRDSATDMAGRQLTGGHAWQFTTASSASVSLRSIGTGTEQFWNRSAAHPAWVTSAVQAGPVLVLTHSTGCAPCDEMIAICDPLSIQYSGRLAYYELTSGEDEPGATETFTAYDPDGDPHYVPLTTILTKGPGGTIIWHSWEGAFDEATLVSWIDDAIEYHYTYR